MIGQTLLPAGVGLPIRHHPHAAVFDPLPRWTTDQDVIDEGLAAPARTAVTLGDASQLGGAADLLVEWIVLFEPSIEVAQHDERNALITTRHDPFRHEIELRHQRQAGVARLAAEAEILTALLQMQREQTQLTFRRLAPRQLERDIDTTPQARHRVQRERGD